MPTLHATEASSSAAIRFVSSLCSGRAFSLVLAASVTVGLLPSAQADPPLSALPTPPKVARDLRTQIQTEHLQHTPLRNMPPAGFDIVVQFDNSQSVENTHRTLKSYAVRLSRLGLLTHKHLSHLNLLATRVTEDEIAALEANPHVTHISADRPLSACADYAMEAIGANSAQTSFGLTGRGVTVAVLDTGISPHIDLTSAANPGASRIIGWVDLVNGNTQPYDDNGHGTHVAGIIAGNGNYAAQNGYNTSLARVAPEANLVGVKVLDSAGAGTTSRVIAGIDWCITNKDALNIRVLNLSLGAPVMESYLADPICQACERAWAAGLVVVVAAGNNGRSDPSNMSAPTLYGSITSPGNDPYVITVGATKTMATLDTADDAIATYSSRGPTAFDFIAKPDLVAPGNHIVSLTAAGSTLATQLSANLVDPTLYGGGGSSGYFDLSGTSMASPMVAGAAALLLQANPRLTPDGIKADLMLTATKLPGATFVDQGAGYINIPAALRNTTLLPSAAPSPTAAIDANSIVDISNIMWGDNYTKPTTKDVLWGQNVPWGQNMMWGEHIMWGDNFTKTTTKDVTWGDNYSWGASNIMWGDNFTKTKTTNIMLGE